MNPLLWAILVCVLGGSAAGWVSGKIMSGEGRDLVMDVVMGLAGGLAGGFIAGATGQRFHGNLIYIGLAAIAGSVALTILSRAFGGRREYGSTN
jgi:uncharacterized membrane protein YeaQ/YmgE (transglycosylase-associated protein family)